MTAGGPGRLPLLLFPEISCGAAAPLAGDARDLRRTARRRLRSGLFPALPVRGVSIQRRQLSARLWPFFMFSLAVSSTLLRVSTVLSFAMTHSSSLAFSARL